MFAQESSLSKESNLPLMPVNKQKKKIIQKNKIIKRKNSWDFFAGFLYSYGPKKPGDDNYRNIFFPLLGVSYKNKAFEVNIGGMGIDLRYSFFDKPMGFSSGFGIGQKVDGKTYENGYKPGIINNISYSAGVYAYFFKFNYTYFPFRIIHPPKKNQFVDAHFLDLSLDLPGFPILLKPFFCGIKGDIKFSVMDDNYAKAFYNYYDKNGNSVYKASGGLRSFSYSINPNIMFNKHWMLMASFSREYFLGDAKNSPIMEQSVQNTISTILMFLF